MNERRARAEEQKIATVDMLLRQVPISQVGECWWSQNEGKWQAMQPNLYDVSYADTVHFWGVSFRYFPSPKRYSPTNWQFKNQLPATIQFSVIAWER